MKAVIRLGKPTPMVNSMWMNFHTCGNAGVGKLVVEANGRAEDQEEPEDQARQRLAEHLAVGLRGQHAHTRRRRPAAARSRPADGQTTRTGCAPSKGSVPWDQSQARAEQQKQDLRRHAQGRQLPHDHGDGAGQSDEGCARLRVFLAPGPVGEIHAVAHEPRTDHQQRQADIEGPLSHHGRVEGVEHRGVVHQDRHGGGHQARPP